MAHVGVEYSQKLDGVAPMETVPPYANSTPLPTPTLHLNNL